MKSNKNFKNLVLGTAQFGLDYGINNPNGKPPIKKTIEMLKYAWDSGITIFDTAESYGNAEQILGEFIKGNNLSNKIKIVSKLMPNLFSGNENAEYVLRIIKSEIKKSLKKLNISKLYGFLLHTPENIYNKNIVDALIACKNAGLIENFGVSIYEEKDALYASKLPVDFIQIPYSVFDQRLNKTNFFKICKKNKVTVFARSAFLQGLIMMDEQNIPHYLKEAKIYLKKFKKIIKKYDLSMPAAALLFSYNKTGVDYVVFGVDNLQQLKENLEIIKKNKVNKNYLNDTLNEFLNIKKSIIFPSLWKKK